MKQSFPWFWILAPAVLLLLPGPAGRLLLDLLGGLTLTLLLLPLLAGAAGLVVWQLLKRRLRTCPACGFVSTGMDQCPACGTLLDRGDLKTGQDQTRSPIDASQATIDIQAEDISDAGGRG